MVSGKRLAAVLVPLSFSGIPLFFIVQIFEAEGLLEALSSIYFLAFAVLMILAVTAGTIRIHKKVQTDKCAPESSVSAEPVETPRTHFQVALEKGYEILPAGCRIGGKMQIGNEIREVFIDLVDERGCFMWPPLKQPLGVSTEPAQNPSSNHKRDSEISSRKNKDENESGEELFAPC